MLGLSSVAKDLENLFLHEVFNMIEAEGKITDVVIENLPCNRFFKFKSFSPKAKFLVWYDKATKRIARQNIPNMWRSLCCKITKHYGSRSCNSVRSKKPANGSPEVPGCLCF